MYSVRAVQQTEIKMAIDSGLVGRYVIVRCHDAGVHAGVLKDQR